MGDRRWRRIARSRLWEPLARRRRILVATGVAGLCLGAAVPLLSPPEAIATTSLILTHRTGEDPSEAMTTDMSLVKSRQLAARVVAELNLSQTPDELLKQYSARSRTDRVMDISVRAGSGAEAKRIARDISAQFLTFRLEESNNELAPLRRMLVDSESEIAGLRHTAVPTLTNGGSDENATMKNIGEVEDRVQQAREQLGKEEAATKAMSNSLVLNQPTVRTPSVLLPVVRGGAFGLALGLAGVAGLVVVSSLLSDRPWRGREIAAALGAPVAHEVGRYRPDNAVRRALVPSRRPDPRAFDTVVERVCKDLAQDRAIRPTLAIVSVDCTQSAAAFVTAVAVRCAEDDRRVLVADLTGRGAAARELGAALLGTSNVRPASADTDISVHRPDAVEPMGRLRTKPGADGEDDDLLVAWALSDVVLTLAELTPTHAATHLHTWANRGIAVAAAGRSSAARLKTIGELLRAADLTLESAVVLEAAETADSSVMTADIVSPATDLPADSVEAER